MNVLYRLFYWQTFVASIDDYVVNMTILFLVKSAIGNYMRSPEINVSPVWILKMKN